MANKTNPFDEIRMKSAGQVRSATWYRDQVKNIGKTRFNPQSLSQNRELNVKRLYPGGLYLFSYDPKTKNQLPYYDTLPLVYPFRMLPNGFLGYNLHYLPYALRFKVMGVLLDVRYSRLPEVKKELMAYGILNQLEVGPYFKPCIKRYLNSQVRSNFILIPEEDWLTASMLPIEQFQKAGSQKVWYDSRKTINAA